MDDMPRREGGHSWCQNVGKDAPLSFGGFKIQQNPFLVVSFLGGAKFPPFWGIDKSELFFVIRFLYLKNMS